MKLPEKDHPVWRVLDHVTTLLLVSFVLLAMRHGAADLTGGPKGDDTDIIAGGWVLREVLGYLKSRQT